jgi:hypothetical protein
MLIVAIEDKLSETVAKKVAKHVLGKNTHLRTIVGNGFGNLRKKVPSFCEASRHYPVWLLTDLDRWGCPEVLIKNWLDGKSRPANFCFRVAVKEVEAWLLADREKFADYLGVSKGKIFGNPDAIEDPKRFLLDLVRKGKRAIQEDLLPPKGSAASQGFGYNARLCNFVDVAWSPDRAASQSRSLEKAMARLSELGGAVSS